MYPLFEALIGGRRDDGADGTGPRFPEDPRATGPDRLSTMANNAKLTSREAALARRKAQSTKGKTSATQSASSAGRTRPAAPAPAPVATARMAPAAPAPAPTPTPRASLSAPTRPARAAAPGSSTRAKALARREAMSKAGARAVKSRDRVRDGSARTAAKSAAAAPAPGQSSGARDKGCSCGCKGRGSETQASLGSTFGSPVSSAAPMRVESSRPLKSNAPSSKGQTRALVLARRAALSTRGKAAAGTPTSAAAIARQANPKLSARELAQKVREQRSHNGGMGETKRPSAGQVRMERRRGSADQPWKVGTTETAGGQTITGTRVGRSPKTTGDEPSTCRTITGTEYMGADIFREFCQSEPEQGPAKVRITSTGQGNRVTGNEVGRSTRVTGDEPGTCKNVTGTQYLAPEQLGAFCGVTPPAGPMKVGLAETYKGKAVSGTLVGRSAKVTGDEHGAGVRPTGTQYTDAQGIRNGRVDTEATAARVPPKVAQSRTLAGRNVTGTLVGRSGKVTGDEPGSCRNITGDEYLSAEQFEAFCETRPAPEPAKVGVSMSQKGLKVSGTQTGRSGKVTGDEPGTCKAVTGTPYAGLEQAAAYCEPPARQAIAARTRTLAATPGPRLTGQQPGIGGVMTGAGRGACEPISGTPYVGADQFADTCGATPADSDFPRAIGGGEPAPWQQFSVISPAREAFQAHEERGSVTGTRYETGANITGPFDMGVGKITGTEQFRFDTRRGTPPVAPMSAMAMAMAPSAAAEPAPAVAPEPAPAAPARSRVTGEGQSAGAKITGDDWDRGERVTGTEGTSAKRRNPTRPGAMGAMPPVDRKRNEEVPAPVSRVTGSSGSTERGALVTYSGGARG